MGVPVLGALSEALQLEEVNGGRFEKAAVWLESLGADGLARTDDRDRRWRDVRDRMATSTRIWVGPYGDQTRARVAKLEHDHGRTEPGGVRLVADGRDGFLALVNLAGTARSVGRAIDAAQRDHRNRAQGLLGNANDLVQRAWTNAQDLVGAESDADAQRTRHLIDEANRTRAAAEAEVERQLDIWRAACEAAADAVERSTVAFREALPDPAAVSPEGAPGLTDPLERWLADQAEPFLRNHAGDPSARRRFWDGLTAEQRDALLHHRPDLVEAHLLDVLTADERSRFFGIRDAHQVRGAIREAGLDPDRFDPITLRGLDPADPEYRRLLDLLHNRLQEMRGDPARAAEYFRTLGIEGLWAQIGLIEHALDAAVESGDERERDRIERLVAATALAFAPTTGRPETARVRERLLRPETPWQLHQAGVLTSARGDRYDPGFLVQAFDMIDAHSSRLLAGFGNQRTIPGSPEHTAQLAAAAYPMGTLDRPLYRDLDLLMPGVVARRALAQNPEASWQALADPDRARAHGRLERLITYETGERAVAYGGVLAPGTSIDQLDPAGRQRLQALRASGETHGAAVLNSAIKAHAVDQHPRAYEVYVDGVRTVAAGGTTVAGQRVMAGNLATYLPDLADGQWLQVPGTRGDTDLKPQAARQVNPRRPEMIAFFTELAADPEAMKATGGAYRQWLWTVGAGYDPAKPNTPGWERATQEASLMVGVVRKGLLESGEQMKAAAGNLGQGWESAGGAILNLLAEAAGQISPVPFTDKIAESAADEAAKALGEHLGGGADERARAQAQAALDFYAMAVTELQLAIDTHHPDGKDSRPDPFASARDEPYGALVDPDLDAKLDWPR